MDLDLAQRAGGVGLGERPLHDGQRLGELAADVDVAHFGLDRMHRDQGALEQRVRGPAHDLPVLERPRLRLVGIHAQVVGLLLLLGHERPLQAGRKPGTTAAAQPRVLHFLDDRRRRQGAGALQRLVAPALHPPLVAARV